MLQWIFWCLVRYIKYKFTFKNFLLMLPFSMSNIMVLLPIQNVLRNWYARDPDIVCIFDCLVEVAWKCAKSFEQGK